MASLVQHTQDRSSVETSLSLKRESFLRSVLPDQNVTLQALPSDASLRTYYRVRGADQHLMLMEDPVNRPDYAGTMDVRPFYKVAEHLRRLGLNTPDIHAHDFENGLLLLEDFGDQTYTRLFEGGVDPRPLYELAIDVLIHLHNHPDRCAVDVPTYTLDHYLAEADLLIDWYLPVVLGRHVSAAEREHYHEVWTEILSTLPKDQDTIVLRDYHVDNLMEVEGYTGLEKCGLLDFQDAVIGPMAYDVMSLLEDARRAVDPDLYDHLLYSKYLPAMKGVNQQSFMRSFYILAAQRHAKVLGIFVRLFKRDGKPRYLSFLPHIHTLFMAALDQQALAPLKHWFETCNIDITVCPSLDHIQSKGEK